MTKYFLWRRPKSMTRVLREQPRQAREIWAHYAWERTPSVDSDVPTTRLYLLMLGFGIALLTACATARGAGCPLPRVDDRMPAVEWVDRDWRALNRASYVCVSQYDGCMVTFIRVEPGTYRAICKKN